MTLIFGRLLDAVMVLFRSEFHEARMQQFLSYRDNRKTKTA